MRIEITLGISRHSQHSRGGGAAIEEQPCGTRISLVNGFFKAQLVQNAHMLEPQHFDQTGMLHLRDDADRFLTK